MSKKEKKNAKIIVPIVVVMIILIIVAVYIFFVPVVHNDCDSPCSGGDPWMSCPDVCVKTEQTIWDILTGQKRTIGY